jgi:predicted flavoprotein YhiN
VALIAESGRMLLKNCLSRYGIPERIIARLFEITGVPVDLRASHADRKTRRDLAGNLCSLSFTVEALGDYDEAMVTRGGISLDEVNRNTMESRLVPRLYFAGEVLDADGDTGGYNLQCAFSTGALAGRSISRYLQG